MSYKKQQNLLYKFFIGFLLPYVFFNGIILFIFIQTPKIHIVDTSSSEYVEGKIKFDVENLLPISSIKTFYQENEISYTKLGQYYSINANENGTYQIKVTLINDAVANSYVDIETIEVESAEDLYEE